MASTKLAEGSTWVTKPLASDSKRARGDFKAKAGDDKFSSLQRKQIMSTMQSLPTQTQSRFLLTEWSQLQTLMKPSEEDLRAARASATVAEEETERSGGLPRQRSATWYADKPTAIQDERIGGDGVLTEKWNSQKRRGEQKGELIEV